MPVPSSPVSDFLPPPPHLLCALNAVISDLGARFKVHIGGASGVACIDTGASDVFVTQKFVDMFNVPSTPYLALPVRVVGAVLKQCDSTVKLRVQIGSHVSRVTAYLLDDCGGNDMLLGRSWIEQTRCNLTVRDSKLIARIHNMHSDVECVSIDPPPTVLTPEKLIDLYFVRLHLHSATPTLSSPPSHV